MQVNTKIEKIAPGNPFLSDAVRMGVQIGTNVTIMMMNHADEVCRSLIVVDTLTGERILINFDDTLRLVKK